MRLPRGWLGPKHLIFKLKMTVSAFTDYIMLFNSRLLYLLDGVAGEAVTAALSHGVRIGSVALDASQHRFVTFIFMDCRNQVGMTGKTVTCTGEEIEHQQCQNDYYTFHDAILPII